MNRLDDKSLGKKVLKYGFILKLEVIIRCLKILCVREVL